MKRLRYKNGPLDEIDRKLMQALAADARMSLAGLARRVGLSPPSVSERIRRLEEAGIIRGYTVEIDPSALGLPISAWLRIRPIPGRLQQVAEIIRQIPEIVQCDRITGDDCFIARAHVTSVGHLEKLIDQIIPHATTNTAVIQSSPVEGRLPWIPIEQRE